MGGMPQAMRPHGFKGRVFGWFMDRRNARTQDFVLGRLDVRPLDRILEIGFGTGRLVRKLARKAHEGFICGIDPSELMLHKAEKRTRRFRKKGCVELRLGEAAALPWPDACFDKVAALHCFQFWADPEHDLAEVKRVLKPGGLLVLVLRRRRRAGPRWLPNPISRKGQEILGAFQLVSASGFKQTRIEGKAGSSPMITAVKA
jgi:ubiquinone/menaquinone biosynthesis C-methylase UbiE